LEGEYNGSVENRARFILEVARETIEAIGADKVGIRVSPYGVFNNTGPFQNLEADFEYLARELGKLKLAYIHIVDHSAMGAPEVPRSVKENIRDAFGGTLIISGGYDSPEKAEQDLQAGLGHLVAFGRPFISNPDLVERLEQNAELAQPDFDTFYTPGPKGYTDYPTLKEVEA
jgi:N-ethylmaleimide reductase